MAKKNRSRSRGSDQAKTNARTICEPVFACQDMDPVQAERARAHANALCWARQERKALDKRLNNDHGLYEAIAAHRAESRAMAPKLAIPDAGIAYPKHPALAQVFNAMLASKASDVLLEMRPSISPSWHMRTAGETVLLAGELIRDKGESIPDAARLMPDVHAFLSEAAEAFGMENEDGSAIDWEDLPKPGAALADLGSHQLHVRIQSLPVYPAGFSLILRASATVVLTAEQEEESSKREAELQRLIKLIPVRREENAREYANERAAQLGARNNEHDALFAAVEAGDSATLGRMLEEGADPSWRIWRERSGNRGASRSMPTPLILAASLGHAECVSILLPFSEVDAVSFGGETALHAATRGGHLECMRLLIPASLVDAPNFEGRAALAEAAWVDAVEAVRLLAPCSMVNLGSGCLAPLGDSCEPEPHCTALWLAAQEGYFECCKILMEHGADPRIANPQGKTAITNEGRLDWRCLAALRSQAARFNEREALSAAIADPATRNSPRRI